MQDRVDKLIIGGEILTQNAKRERILYGALAVDGDKIVAVGSQEDLQTRFQAEEIVNAGGKIILPGLINAHTHAAMTIFRGVSDDVPLEPWLQKIWPLEIQFATEENVALGTELAFAEMIRGGTTSAADMYWHHEVLVDTAKKVGFRLATGIGVLETLYNEDKAALEKRIRDYIEKYMGDDLITPCSLVHSTYAVSRATLLLIKKITEDYGVVLMTHAAESKAELENVFAQTGKTPIHYLEELGMLGRYTMLAHGVHLNDDEIRLLAEKQTSIVHCLSSNLKLGSGIARTADLLAGGVNVAIGTDGCASNNNLDMWEEMHMASLVQKGIKNDPTVMPAEQVLYMATMGGAIALNLDNKVGSLETGKQADLIIVDTGSLHFTPIYDAASHLVFTAQASDVEATMVAGRWLMREKKLLTIDEEGVKQETRSLAEKIKETL